ncbi:MAG: hypothetical protein M1281_04145 [Chloroflexi bacterium]|nr:hypothetical protein [Chloroflexota bacterium]
MKIFSAKFDKAELIAVPSEEQSFFFGLAHLVNEMNALEKLVLWSEMTPAATDIDRNGQVSLTFLLLRLLAGKLNEGNGLLQNKFHSTKWSKQYVGQLSADGSKALSEIKKYFGRANLVKHIRNNSAFHYSPEEMAAILPTVPEDLELYLSDGGTANSLYYFAEVLVNRAILNHINSADHQAAYRTLVRDLTTLAHSFLVLAEALMVVFISQNQNQIWDGFAKEVPFEKLPAFTDIRLPWFTDTTSLRDEQA